MFACVSLCAFACLRVFVCVQMCCCRVCVLACCFVVWRVCGVFLLCTVVYRVFVSACVCMCVA